MTVDFDHHYARLLAPLDEAVLLMGQHGEEFWSAQIGELRDRLAEHDAYGLDLLLTCFGGMGSWTDLVIHPLNGHTIDEDELDQVNGQLQALRGEVWQQAEKLRRELRSSS